MEAKASHYAARCAPRKVRLLRPLVIGKSVADAIATLAAERRCGSVPAIKLFRSAMAQLPGSVGASAVITEFMVNEGPKRRMFMPRAKGRACPVLKRTSHLSVRLKVAE
jgi:large subunit ribosomal protein L22